MKTKLLAIVLCILMLVQPTMAIGMVGMESAEEIVAKNPEQEQEEKAELESTATDVHPSNVVFFDDFEGNEVKDWGEGKSASYTFAYQTGDTSVSLGTTDRNSKEVDGVTYNSNPHWQIIDDNGDKVLYMTQYAATHNNAGFDFNNLKFEKPGIYTLSFNLKLELGENAEGFGASAGSDFTWFQAEKKDAAGNATSAGPSNSGINATNGATMIGNWKTIEYKYVMTENEDGTRTIAPAYSNMNGYRSPSGSHTYAEGEYLSRIRHYIKTYPAGKSQSKIYLDDVKLTFDGAVNVTYVDAKNNNTLATALMYEGDTITLKHDTLGLTYATQFEINGVKYNDGDTYTIPYGTTALTIKAGRYEMPENAPVNSIVYEDFDRVASSGFTSIHNAPTYADEEFFDSSAPTFGSYGGGTKSFATFDGKKVAKWAVNTNSYYGIRLLNVNLTKPGSYVFSADYYMELDEEIVLTTHQNNLHSKYLESDDQKHYGFNSNEFTTDTTGKIKNEWVNSKARLNVTVDENGQLYFNGKAGESLTSYLWFMVKKCAQDPYAFNFYVDTIALQYFAPVTVNVVDEKGATLATYDVYQNDSITLPAANSVSYNATLTYGGNTYDFGGNFVVPADAASEITITAARKTMPAHLPANTVLYEDFQNRTVGANIASTAVTYTTEAFDGSTIYNTGDGSRESAKYEYAPDDSSDVTMKIVATDMYGSGVYINIPDDIAAGKYTVVNHFWIDDDTINAENTGYLHSISEWCRVWYGSAIKEGDTVVDKGYVGASKTVHYNTADTRKTWNEYSFDFEVYEEDGVKYVGIYSADKAGAYESHALIGQNLYIKLHNTVGNSASGSVAFYHDDVYITYEAPIEISFVDENGDSFAFAQNYNNLTAYKLPSADKMGINYLVEFVGEDGKTYYPGMTYTFEEGATAAEFVVKKTDVIFFEDFEGLTKTNAWLTPTYAAGPFESATIFGNNINNNVNGTNSNVITVANPTGNTTPELLTINLKQPGVYKFTMDVELMLEKKAETDLVDNNFYVNFQRISGWNNAGSNVYLREGELKKRLSAYVEIYEGSDGKMYHRLGSHTGTVFELTETANDKVSPKQYPIKAFRTGLIWSDAFLKSTEQKATYHYSVDNIKVEYMDMSPVNTMKASYRAINEGETGGPEGIRFAAYVSNNQRELASEYGFVVTRKSMLTTDGVTDYTKLNLKGIDSVSATVTTTDTNSDGVAVVAAAAYNGTVDRVYVQDGKVFGLQGLYDTFYTAVLYGLTTDVRKAEVFVARPYAKIDGVYYYGDCHETSYNDVKAAAEKAANA